MDTRTARHAWQAAVGELQLQITRSNYETFLRDTELISCDDGLFLVGAGGMFAVEWLENRLRPLVCKTLSGIVGEPVNVRFVVRPALSSGGPSFGAASETSLRSHGAVGLAGTDQQVRTIAPPQPGLRLNTRFTFKTFVVGSSNRLAHAAAVACAERPGEAYNPLFVYGGVGLGKTHLLHAIGHTTVQNSLTILYVSSEQFTNEFINAIRERRNEEFRAKYRSVDVLLIDDIQFIAGKEQTQEEFFHTFNDLHSSNRQIVLTSDRHPKSMPLLEDRLRSRFEWGLIADIQPPDLETRVAILRTKAEEHDVDVATDALDYIAEKISSNIRELEGTLNRVVAHARLTNSRVTLELAKQCLGDLGHTGNRFRLVTPDLIIETVAQYYGVRLEDLKSRKRDREIAHPRQIAMYLMREETPISLVEIGHRLGGRDHTTVMHGCQKVANEVQANQRLRREVFEIKDQLLSARNAL